MFSQLNYVWLLMYVHDIHKLWLLTNVWIFSFLHLRWRGAGRTRQNGEYAIEKNTTNWFLYVRTSTYSTHSISHTCNLNRPLHTCGLVTKWLMNCARIHNYSLLAFIIQLRVSEVAVEWAFVWSAQEDAGVGWNVHNVLILDVLSCLQ